MESFLGRLKVENRSSIHDAESLVAMPFDMAIRRTAQGMNFSYYVSRKFVSDVMALFNEDLSSEARSAEDPPAPGIFQPHIRLVASF